MTEMLNITTNVINYHDMHTIPLNMLNATQWIEIIISIDCMCRLSPIFMSSFYASFSFIV